MAFFVVALAWQSLAEIWSIAAYPVPAPGFPDENFNKTPIKRGQRKAKPIV